MNNMDLTRAFHQMQAQVNDLDARLQANIPKVEQDVANIVTDVKTMFEALKADFKPEIDKVPAIIEAMSKLETLVEAEKQRMKDAEDVVYELRNGRADTEEKIKKTAADINAMKDSVQNVVQHMSIESQARIGQDVKLDVSQAKLEQLVHEHEHLKRTEETHYAQQQMQIATAISTGTPHSGGNVSSGSGSKEPLATNKLVMSEDKIAGTEDKQELED